VPTAGYLSIFLNVIDMVTVTHAAGAALDDCAFEPLGTEALNELPAGKKVIPRRKQAPM
jgi:hypothetical protein